MRTGSRLFWLCGVLLATAPLPCGLSLGSLSRFPSLAAQLAPPAKVAASLQRVFGPVTRVDSLAIDTALVLRVWNGDSLQGFARVRNVKGKDQPITYLVAVDSALRLRDVDILVYREAYGGEVAYEAWRRQFRGRGPDDPLEVGREIRSISGATISVNAVTLGVRRTVAELAEWRRVGRL
jgi:Na+-translocating ferredoxin:NAD+ oxidoreductase RnfG subunit